MFFGISHLDYQTSDLARARRLFLDTFGFRLVREGEGVCDIDSGSVLIRLIEMEAVEVKTAFRIQVSEVEKALELLSRGGLTLRRGASRTEDQELVGSLTDPDGHLITVWRPLTEDEYETPVPLPTALRWPPESEALMQQLLKGVPALFRALARRRVVKEAEELAGPRGSVGREEVIRGFILSNAKVTRKQRARPPLEKAGIDPDLYQDDFEAP